jgi:hypothetical protein
VTPHRVQHIPTLVQNERIIIDPPPRDGFVVRFERADAMDPNLFEIARHDRTVLARFPRLTATYLEIVSHRGRWLVSGWGPGIENISPEAASPDGIIIIAASPARQPSGQASLKN